VSDCRSGGHSDEDKSLLSTKVAVLRRVGPHFLEKFIYWCVVEVERLSNSLVGDFSINYICA